MYFKSSFGLSLMAIPRAGSFCDCTLAQDGVFVTEDARRTRVSGTTPLSPGRSGLRFYAGAPLRSPDGYTIGILCLADSVPRALPEDSRASLVSLAEFRDARGGTAPGAAPAGSRHRQDQVAENGTGMGRSVGTCRRSTLRLQKAYNELEGLDGPPHRRAGAGPSPGARGRRARVAEAALRTARAELEARITERTAALERANQELQRQMAERQEAEKRLGESRQRYRSLFEQNRDAVYSFNREGRFLSANAACEALSGYTPQELLQMSFRESGHPGVRGARPVRCSRRRWRARRSTTRLVITRKDGRRVEISVSKMPILINGEIVGAFGVSRDVTERRELERERERLLAEAVERADCDALTGLANHGAFHRELHEALQVAGQSGQRLTVVLLDMDDFRFLNNAYGHVVGDAVLRQVAGRWKNWPSAKSGATLWPATAATSSPCCCRRPRLAEADALALALAARLDFRPPGHDSAIPLTLSAGAARFPDDGATRPELLGVADTRLRRAKTGGAGQVDQLRTALSRSVEGFSMLDALVAAVDNKDRYTRRHSEDVLTYSLQVAEALGLDEATRHTVAVAALLHDVGKIGVPDAILRKPGALTGGEFEAVKQHPMMGSVIVGAVPGFEGTLDAVRHHHERWDGGGYPFGLAGGEIPLLARLMAVADAFSAMTTDRPYRKGMSGPQATAFLLEGGPRGRSGTRSACAPSWRRVGHRPVWPCRAVSHRHPEDSSCRSRADCE